MSWFSPCTWTWPRETISGDDGLADVAYVSLFMVAGAVVAAILLMTIVAAAAYFRCHSFEVNGVTVNCTFDPQPLGIAIGAACGGLATALGALAGYMVATRRPPRVVAPPAPTATTVTTTATTVAAPATAEQPAAAEAATDVGTVTIGPAKRKR